MNKEINLINDVINSGAKTGFDEDAVNDAWSKILNHLAVEGYYDEDIDEDNNDKRTAMYYDNDGKNI
jgi:hypothetical protein